MIVRTARPDDFQAFAGFEIPANFCVTKPVGFVAEDDGRVVAMGLVTWDKYGRAWGWFNAAESVPVWTMHRRAHQMMAILREVGEPFVLAMCSTTIPGSEKWLDRLGFRPAPELTWNPDHPVWRCDISLAAETRCSL